MTKRGKILITGAAVLGLAVIAGSFWRQHHHHGWSGGHGGHGKYAAMRALDALFDKFDADGDAALTRAEAEAARAGLFGGADADNNGALSVSEFQVVWAEMTAPLAAPAFQYLDRDGDGALTEAESERPAARLFDRLDRDDDGRIGAPGRGGRHFWGHHHGGGDDGG